MANRSMVEVFDIVKHYYLFSHLDETRYMCIAARDARHGGQITSEEMNSLIYIIKDEMQAYADLYIPKGNNFRVDEDTTLSNVIVETLSFKECYNTLEDRYSDRDRLYGMAQKIIPIWWDYFYEKLRLLEAVGDDR